MKKNLYKILSFDGGGVRVLIPAQILKNLERKIRQRSGDEDAYLIDYFDMTAGTSSGSLLAILLTLPEDHGSLRPKYCASDALDIFVSYLPQIFKIPVYHQIRTVGGFRDEKYPADVLEKMLEKYAKDFYISELLLPCMITGYDVRRRSSMLFTRHDARKEPWRDFYVKDVARASISAPTYFEVPNIKSRTGVHYPCIDGAVVANNPALCALAEARTHFKVKPDELAILSVGTGIDEKPYFYSEIKDFGAVAWIKPLISFLMGAGSETTDYFCRLEFDSNGVPENYLRLNTELKDLPPDMSSELDDVSPGNIAGLLEIGQELSERLDKELNQFVDMLLESRKRTPEEKFNDKSVSEKDPSSQSSDSEKE